VSQTVKKYKSAKDFEKDQKKMARRGFRVITVEAEGKKPYSIMRGAGSYAIFGPLGLIGGRGRKGKIMVVYEMEEVIQPTVNEIAARPTSTAPTFSQKEFALSLSPQDYDEICSLLQRKKKIQAIKTYRALTGKKLGEAKNCIDRFDHHLPYPELEVSNQNMDDGAATLEQLQNPSDEVAGRLELLADLHKKGIVSDMEFEMKKKELLSQL